MVTDAAVTKTYVFVRQLPIPKLNEFAIVSNLQALQHSYRNNILPSFLLISLKTLKPYLIHT